MNKERVAELVHELLLEIGEDPDREGLVKTPERVAEAYRFLTSGYSMNLDEVINGAVFESEANNMILCKDIEVYSLCEHHMLPFFGTCHIGYIAKDKVIGVSKMARIVDYYARRLQIQERLTSQIAHTIREEVGAEGCRRGYGVPSYVHDDAGRSETELFHGYLIRTGQLPLLHGYTGRVYESDREEPLV